MSRRSLTSLDTTRIAQNGISCSVMWCDSVSLGNGTAACAGHPWLPRDVRRPLEHDASFHALKACGLTPTRRAFAIAMACCASS